MKYANQTEFFNECGGIEMDNLDHRRMDNVTIEELYQHFKKRLDDEFFEALTKGNE